MTFWTYTLIGAIIGLVPTIKTFSKLYASSLAKEITVSIVCYVIFTLTWPYFVVSWSAQFLLQMRKQ